VRVAVSSIDSWIGMNPVAYIQGGDEGVRSPPIDFGVNYLSYCVWCEFW